jgi:poly(A) polymerase
VLRLIEQPRFRAAYDLLVLRAQVGMAQQELVEWWAALQAAHPEGRMEMVLALEAARGGGRGAGQEGGGGGGGRPRRRRRRRRSS